MFMRDFKTILLWLLLLTVPFQGFPAMAMLSCQPFHHDMNASQSPQAGQPVHRHQIATNIDPIACADQHAHCAAGADLDSDRNDVADQPHGASKCSACSLCIGAAMAPTLSDLVATPPASHLIAFFPKPFVGHIAGRIERPPSTRLA